MPAKFSLLISILLFAVHLTGQSEGTPNFWNLSSDTEYRTSQYQREIVPEKYLTYDLDIKGLEKHLDSVLPKIHVERREQNTYIYIPSPSGQMELYTIWRDDLLPKKLNDRYPEISVFAGYANEDPSKTIRMDFTSKGFRVVAYGNNQSTFFIDPIARGVKSTVISYYKKDYRDQQAFECLVEDAIEVDKHSHSIQRIAGDCDLHTFELALACTGEYAAFHGGTKTSVMAEYTTSINRVNGLYEKEVGVNMVFVPNTDDLIFLDGNTDPYTNNNGGQMLGQNQSTCDNIIGSNNYDIGHVYSTGGGGIAQLQSPCSNNGKARGVTGLPSPVGDPFYVDYVAHEIGHQFGATHTFNNSCGGNRSGQTAFEPGSGATIMAYAGICPPNVQFASDAYFHSASLVQIGNFLANTSCEDITSNGSDRPIIAPMQNYNIPINTPFELTASAAVSDGSSLTYCWEQMDNEIANMPPESTSGSGPLFRSYDPVASPARVFPSFPFLLSNTDNEWEVLPGATRDINFRVTVRASAPGKAGCTEELDLTLNVNNSAGPFLVLTPNTNTIWTVGETQPIVWQVANTNASPINCDDVRILLSTDGGFTYPITLEESTPNDGQADIIVPNFPGNQVRVRVQAVDNVFFDISNENLTIIEPVVPTFSMSANPEMQSVCGSNAGIVQYEISTTSLAGFNEEVEFSVTGLPAGISATFDNNNETPNATTTLNLDGLSNLSTGTYSFTVQGNGGGQSNEVSLNLMLIDSAPNASQLFLPENASVNVSPSIVLNWSEVITAEGYIVEVSESYNFDNIIFSQSLDITNTTPEGLSTATTYYWRVRSNNICGNGSSSEVYRFRTGAEACFSYSNDTPVSIPASSSGTFSSIISVPSGDFVEEVSLSTVILHSWIGDLDANLVTPDGEVLPLFDRPGVPDDDFGCARDNIRATFDDNAINDADDFETACGTGLYAIDDTYQPIVEFSTLAGNNSGGDWILEVTDHVVEDGGSINSWGIEICTFAGPVTPPEANNNNPLTVIKSSSETITDNELLFADGGILDNIKYTLISLPSEGTLFNNGNQIQVGEIFTQADVNNNLVTYNHNGNDATMDSFIFDVEEVNGGWSPNNTFLIEIVEPNFTAEAVQLGPINCFGENTGSIIVNTSEGTSPFTYSIDSENFQEGATFEDLAAGEYTITVADADNNIATTNTVILEQPNQLTLEATVNENTVSLNANGGTGAWMYSLDNMNYQESNVFENLDNGQYTFYVIDENECIATTDQISILINNLSATASITSEITCFGNNDGMISIEVQGGSPNYTYTLNQGAPQTSNIFENLSAGEYVVTVIDANNFSVQTNTLVLSDPPVLSVEATIVNDVVFLEASGGTGTYQYAEFLNNFQNESQFILYDNGLATFYAKDENECIASVMVFANFPALSISLEVTQEINCTGGVNGEISVNATGGTPPYQYELNGNIQNESAFSNLTSGTYTFSVIDSRARTASASIFLDQPDPISLQVNTNGSEATLVALGGTPPYRYAINNGLFQDEPTFQDLDNGTYSAQVVDANLCTQETTFTISVNNLSASASQLTEILCAGDQTGSISVTASNGTEPYSYSLDGFNFQAENIFNGLTAGQYTITVKDVNELNTTTSINLSEPAALNLDSEIIQNNINLYATGGTSPYEYKIEGEQYQNNFQFTNLTVGSHQFFVRDSNGCEQNIFVDITYEGLGGQAIVSQEIDCHGNDNGIIQVTATGGNTPYMYSINGGALQNSNSFDNLGPDIYIITIVDSDGRKYSVDAIEISEPDPIAISLNIEGRSVTIDALGGTGELNFSLDRETYQEENSFTSLANGMYTIFVIDENNCIAEAEFAIEVEDLFAAAVVVQNPTCFGENDGAILIESTGGVAPLEYALNQGGFQTENLFENLEAGEYTFTVRDANGVTISTEIFILEEPDEINISLDIDQTNLDINATGGTGSLTYSIDGEVYQSDNSFEGLANGNYIAYVQDENQCIAEEAFAINISDIEAILSISQNISCFGEQDGILVVESTGGVSPRSFSIDGINFQEDNFFNNLGAGEYAITVKDAIGNTFMTNVVVLKEPSAISAALNIENNTLNIDASGGTGTLVFSLDGDNFQSSSTFTNLENGAYTVYITDANDCLYTDNFNIEFTSLSASFDLMGENLCHGDMDVTVNLEAVDGVPPYQYSLNGGEFQDNNQFENLGAGSYNFAIRDASGSIVQILNVDITEPSPINLTSQVEENTVELSAVGGTSPYGYSIDNKNFQEDGLFENLDNGEYLGYVVDDNGCSTETSFNINAIAPLSIALTIDRILDCNAEIAGTITANGSGGTPPYLYSLDKGPFEANNVFTNLPPGQYRVTVQDALMNQVSNIAVLTSPDLLEMEVDIMDSDIEIMVTGGAAPFIYSVDGGVNFSNTQVFNDLDPGTYEVLVEDANGCRVSETIEIINTSATSINHDLIISLAPNPASKITYLSIENEHFQDIHISLIDILGRTIRTYEQDTAIGPNQFEIDLTNLVAGTYLLRLELDKEIAIQKLIVE